MLQCLMCLSPRDLLWASIKSLLVNGKKFDIQYNIVCASPFVQGLVRYSDRVTLYILDVGPAIVYSALVGFLLHKLIGSSPQHMVRHCVGRMVNSAANGGFIEPMKTFVSDCKKCYTKIN